MIRPLVLLALLAALVPTTAAPLRTQTDLACESFGPALKLECAVNIRTPEGAPLSGATVTLGASMPSVANARSVRPVMAAPGKKPGEYRGVLELETGGVYSVLVDIAGSARDRVARSVRVEACAANKRCPAVPVSESPPGKK
jgi:hypothetical protein